MLFKIRNKKLVPLREKRIDLEKQIQRLVEDNLETIFGWELVSSEFRVKNFIIDTVAFDPENKAFVIIEFKKDRNFSVIDQGYAYLAAMLNNKADFVLEYNEKKNKKLERNSIDWSQSKVIFIAPSFTTYQKGALSFRDLPIELWEATVYEGNFLSLNQLEKSDKAESIKTISRGSNFEKISKEIKQYTISDHIKPNWSKTKDLFDELSQRMLYLDPNYKMPFIQ